MAKKTGKDKDEVLSEALFEQYLDGKSPVSEAYRELEQAEPPVTLDRRILDEARGAAKPRRKNLLDIDLEFWRHWARPVSTVVIMGVCLTVVLRVMDYETLIPGPPEDADFAMAEQRQSQAASLEKSDRPAAAIASPDSVAKSAGVGEGFAQMMPPDRAVASPEGPPNKEFDSLRSEPVLEEVNVMARKRSVAKQEVPAEVTGLQSEEIVVAARKEADEYIRAEDALTAWEQGARPAAEVWRAGIEAVYPGDELADDPDDQLEFANVELAKMARVYPAEASQTKARYDQMAEAGSEPALQTSFSDQQAPALAGTELEAAAELTVDGETVDPLVDPFVWAAGIDWLYENDRDNEADAELVKFGQIYPDFEID